MRKLCLINCIFSRVQDYVNDIPQQRLVFFVQRLVGQLETSVSSSTVAGGQIMVVLSFVLPAVKDIYGRFWTVILVEIQNTGTQADLYPLHASLRLLNLLRRSYMLDSNDDLLDAWSEKKTSIATGLVDLLRQLQGKHPALVVCIEICRPCDGYNNSYGSNIDVYFVEIAPFLTLESSTRSPR